MTIFVKSVFSTLIFLSITSGILNAQAFSSLEDTAYKKRFKQIIFLGDSFPGQKLSYDPITKKHIGLFSGIYQQTLWQVKSGRDKISLWNVVNAYLSTEVSVFAKHYMSQKKCTAFAGLQKKRCLAWLPYFKMHKNKKPLLSTRSMQRLMWKAHTVTVRTILSERNFHFIRDFNDSEFLFWRGWIRLVFKLEELNYPTVGFFVSPIVSRYMPNCSNLGSEDCKLDDFSFDQRLFLVGLKNGKLDIVMDLLSLKLFK